MWQLNKIFSSCANYYSCTTCLRNSSFSESVMRKPKLSFGRRIFSGIQPTGSVHLGNYLGAIKKWVEIQNEGEDTIFSVVDLHALTMPNEHLNLKENIHTLVATLIACEIDPNKCILYQQSQVPQHANLCWILSCLTTMPRLSALPQFKEKSSVFTNQSIPTGLFIYPILQAADILLYKATHVPVGSDQLQNIHLCSHLCRLFNNRYGEVFPVPEAMVLDDPQSKIKNLRFPANKMSKSDTNSLGRIELIDSPEDILKKIQRAVTDFTSEVYYDPENRPGVSNLMTIHRALTGKTYDQIAKEFSDHDTGKYKCALADIVVDYLAPIRDKTLHILNDKCYIESVLERGIEQAHELAINTMSEVYKKIGF